MSDLPAVLPIDLSDLSLKPSEMKFVVAMLDNDFDESKAAVASGIAQKNHPAPHIRMEGLAMANRPHIRQAIQRYTAMVMDPARDQLQARLVDTLRVRAFYDPDIFFYEDGTARPLSEIPKEYRICIDGISEDFKGKDAQVRVVTYKLADRSAAQKALQELLKRGDKADEPEIPSDAKSRLEMIFASVTKASAEAGAKAALRGHREALEKKNTIEQEAE